MGLSAESTLEGQRHHSGTTSVILTAVEVRNMDTSGVQQRQSVDGWVGLQGLFWLLHSAGKGLMCAQTQGGAPSSFLDTAPAVTYAVSLQLMS